MFDKIVRHIGHSIEVGSYCDPIVNVAVECMDCHEVIVDADSQKEVEKMKVDIGFVDTEISNLCIHCGRDTSFGSGLFADRIPICCAICSSADGRLLLQDMLTKLFFIETVPSALEVVTGTTPSRSNPSYYGGKGYMCPECQVVHPNPLDCDKCEKRTLDYHRVDGNNVWCSDCCGGCALD